MTDEDVKLARDTLSRLPTYAQASTKRDTTDIAFWASRAAAHANAVIGASPPEAPREGWKLVPIKATEQMIVAGTEGTKPAVSYPQVLDIYRAMLAVAPGRSEEKDDA